MISNHFNLYSIIKLILRKKGDEFINRFHHELSISALNPLTNNRIIGEVEFYLIENVFLKIEPKEERYPEG